MHRSAVIVLWLIAGLAFAASQSAEPKRAFQPKAEETRLLELTNAARKKKELPPLTLDPLLTEIARSHSENMARQEKMEHELDKKKAGDRARDAGYAFSTFGENIAVTDPNAALPALMNAWLESPKHRDNLLLPDFTDTGIGVAKGKDGQTYYTQVFAKPRKR